MKPGFKQTEVGVIPEDWEVKSIRELGQLSKGKGIRKNEADSGSIPCIRYGELYTHHNDVIRLYNSRISEQVAKTSRRLNKGDILFAGSGETKEEIGKCAAFIGDEIAYAGGDILVLTPNQGDPRYFGYLFNAPAIARQKAGKGQGDAIVHITAPALSSVRVPLPPTVAEQEAIASALGDADALIESLERLIAKKRDVKQGAMQELLTARRRLPGFTEKWNQYAIHEVASPVSLKNAEGVELPVLTCSKHFGFVDSLGFFKNQVFSNDLCNYKTIRRGEIGYPANHVEEGSIGLQDVYDLALVSPIYVVFAVHDGVSSYFLHRLLKLDSYRQKFKTATSSSVDRRGSLRWPEFSKISVIIPNLQEQTAISAILKEMEEELGVLEAKLAKARAIKQGMMQELLTGRIRLK